LTFIDENTKKSWNNLKMSKLNSVKTNIKGRVIGISADDSYLFVIDCSTNLFNIVDISNKTNWFNFNTIAYSDFPVMKAYTTFDNNFLIKLSTTQKKNFHIYDISVKSKWNILKPEYIKLTQLIVNSTNLDLATELILDRNENFIYTDTAKFSIEN
jgi:hypothetical protein